MRWRAALVGGALALAACAGPVRPTPAVPAVAVVQERPIPGLTAATIEAAMRARGFACGPLANSSARVVCRSSGPASMFELAAWGAAPGEITRVEAAVLLDRPDDALAAEVLGVMAGALPYVGADPPRARAWLGATVPHAVAGRIDQATIGGVTFALSGDPTARLLRLTAPG